MFQVRGSFRVTGRSKSTQPRYGERNRVRYRNHNIIGPRSETHEDDLPSRGKISAKTSFARSEQSRTRVTSSGARTCERGVLTPWRSRTIPFLIKVGMFW